MCEYYTYQTNCLLPDIFLFRFGAAYELRLERYGQKPSPSMQDARVCRVLWLLCTYSVCGTHSQATPGLLNACVTVCEEFASRQLSASRSWTIVFSIYLMLKTILVPYVVIINLYLLINDNALYRRLCFVCININNNVCTCWQEIV